MFGPRSPTPRGRGEPGSDLFHGIFAEANLAGVEKITNLQGMWLALGAVLVVVWGVSLFVFRVAPWAAHLVIPGAVVAAVHVYPTLRLSSDS